MPSVFRHALKRSGRSRRPWWLAILILAAGWVYGTFLAPDKGTNQRTTQRQTEPKKRSSRKRTSDTQSPAMPGMPMEPGGRVLRDVVTKVYDGDTITLRSLGSVRLIGADCPEKAQPGGVEAGNFARSTLMGQNVEVELCAKQPTDRYGRSLGFIYYTERGKRVLFNSELVRQGYARVYSLRPCTVDEDVWNGYYEEARRARRGLFATLGEVPDAADYRRAKRSRS